jgi:hypothetical protein
MRIDNVGDTIGDGWELWQGGKEGVRFLINTEVNSNSGWQGWSCETIEEAS